MSACFQYLSCATDGSVTSSEFIDTWQLTAVLGAGGSRDKALTGLHEAGGAVPVLTLAALISRNGARPPPVSGQVSGHGLG